MDRDEVISATRQWLEKAVIGLNLCPFAKSVYVRDQVRIVVSEAGHLDAFLEELDRELEFLASTDPKEVDTTLLVHPTLFGDFLDFNDFLQLADAAVEEHELEGIGNIIVSETLFQELLTVEESGCIKREGMMILITVGNPPDISINIGMKRDSVSDDVLEFEVNIILHGIVDLAS